MTSSSAPPVGASTSNHVYVRSEEYAWIPARVVEHSKSDDGKITVSIPSFMNEESIQSGHHAKKFENVQVKLSDYPNNALPLQNVDEDGHLKQCEDMVDLAFLHEPAILYNLKARHVNNKPYTRTGDIVIAVNPYKWMYELYSDEKRCSYAHALVWDDYEGDPRCHVEPHVYETSSLAYRGLAVEQQHQSILVSGESGAGKTETVKILMSHLASVQMGVSTLDAVVREEHEHEKSSVNRNLAASFQQQTTTITSSPIVQRVLDSNPLLEAFGNAKTIRNDNSSRFGKYIQLQFDAEDPTLAAYSGKSIPSCILAGSKCDVYLLEKSRVVSHEEDERTYHIFHQLLAASNEEKIEIWEGLANTDNESFAYIGYTSTDTIENKTDSERFQLTKQALELIGVKDELFRMLMRAICIVLQLGNLTFNMDPTNEERSVITSTEELNALAELMGVESELITKTLTERTVRARNEEYKVPLNAVKAKDACDAFSKEIYAKAFLWLVRTINDATCAEKNYDGDRSEAFGLIGLLDIFGFESFETNRFEQLCINYANEKLQQKFTQDIFRSVQAEYEFEGIGLGEITYEDNIDVLNLVEGRMGLISVLNEECVRPKGNDVAFVSKVQTMNKDSDCLIVEKSFQDYEFGVKHYAGCVVYDATNFVTKNTDSLPVDLVECARQCTNEIISKHLDNDSIMNVDSPSSSGKKKAPPGKNPRAPPKRSTSSLVQSTVWSKFRNQLTVLMTNLGQTRTRYIRCIKPNTEKKPAVMQHLSTVEQLRCAGVVAAVTISRSAFPNRLEHEIVLERFKSLWTKGNHRASPEHGDPDLAGEELKLDVEHLLTSALRSLEVEKDGGMQKAFVIGKTRAYFRAGALEHLEAERLKGLGVWAVEMQRIVRGFVKRSQYVRLQAAEVKAAAKMREFVARRKYLRQRSAVIVLQCWNRCILAVQELVQLRKNHKATIIQTHFRMMVAQTSFQKYRRAAIIIQAMSRGAIQRPKYRIELAEKIEEAKLENQLKALQRKLEEAEARRVEAEKKAEQNAAPVVVYREQPSEEKKNEAPVEGEGEMKPPAEVTTTVPAEIDSFASPDNAQLTSQQQTLMDESGKMLEYLRKEVFKLRSQNAQLRTDFDLLKENNQRLMDANASAGASFAALNQHAKQLNKTNAKLVSDIQNYRQQLQRMNIQQVEVKEELKMKQATYIAEVHSRLQYQKTMAEIVDMVQDRCRDSRLVEDVLALADDCEAEYMSGPTGLDNSGPISSLFSSPVKGNNESIVGKFKSFFS